MEPSNSTVVRFVATYGRGFELPVRRLILGFGYGDEGGLNHKKLVEIYLGTKAVSLAKGMAYPGYLYVENDTIRVFAKGGSQTLDIEGSHEMRTKFMAEVEDIQVLKFAVVHLFPLITSGKIHHAMLAI